MEPKNFYWKLGEYSETFNEVYSYLIFNGFKPYVSLEEGRLPIIKVVLGLGRDTLKESKHHKFKKTIGNLKNKRFVEDCRIHLPEKPLKEIVNLEKITDPDHMFAHDYEANLRDHNLEMNIIFSDHNNYRDKHWVDKDSFFKFFKKGFLMKPSKRVN